MLERAQARITYNGWVLFLLGASLVGSGFAATRYNFAGLQVHPYLFLVFIFFPFLAASRLRLIPAQLSTKLIAFAAFYFFTTFFGGVNLGEGMKLSASVVTILTVAMLVHTRADFVAGTVGIALAAAILAFIGIQAESSLVSGNIQAIETGNRNAYSLYALPPLLLGCFVLVREKSESLLLKGVLAGSLLLSALCICLNTNRSGWLGLAVVILLLAYDKSIKMIGIAVLLGGTVLLVITMFFRTDHLQNRVAQTREGLHSDELRQKLIITSIIIGIENPLLGVSPRNLNRELARRLYKESYVELSSHNVYAHLIGGCGLVCFSLFCWIAHDLWAWRAPTFQLYQHRVAFKEARQLLRYTIILYAVRGLFTAEILFSPGFNIAIGLALGYAVINSESANPAMARGQRPSVPTLRSSTI